MPEEPMFTLASPDVAPPNRKLPRNEPFPEAQKLIPSKSAVPEEALNVPVPSQDRRIEVDNAVREPPLKLSSPE